VGYRYRTEDLARPSAFETDVLYVVGGLYGNPEALQAILDKAGRERQEQCRVRIVFNGDFNWFNAEGADFDFINRTVLAHDASAGNVEVEIATPSPDGGCGCAYPAYVSERTVQRSNAIIQRLQQTAIEYPELRRALASLPRHLVVSVAGERIAILHGDPESLAGWVFSAECMPPLDATLRKRLRCETAPVTPLAKIIGYFRRASVRAFACTHTCLPFAQLVEWPGDRGLVINNGAAGMPNFRDTHFGVMTRFSADSAVPVGSLYGVQLGRLRCDAIAVEYDHAGWLRRFCRAWPPGSPAHQSYFRRLTRGPDYGLKVAVRAGLCKTAAKVIGA
jgi:hypothetical protein